MLKLDYKVAYKEVNYDGQVIKVKDSIPVMEKAKMLEYAANACRVGMNMSRAMFEAIFYALVAIKYSDIEFEGMGEKTMDEVYDILRSNDLLKLIIDAIPKEEFQSLAKLADAAYQEALDTSNSAVKLTENLTAEMLKLLILLTDKDDETKQKVFDVLNEKIN